MELCPRRMCPTAADPKAQMRRALAGNLRNPELFRQSVGVSLDTV